MIPCTGKGSPGFVLGAVIEENRQTGAGLLCPALREWVKTQEAEGLRGWTDLFLACSFQVQAPTSIPEEGGFWKLLAGSLGLCLADSLMESLWDRAGIASAMLAIVCRGQITEGSRCPGFRKHGVCISSSLSETGSALKGSRGTLATRIAHDAI